MSLYHDVIHDILLEVVDHPTDDMINQLHEKLPREIKLEALVWGWSDTCVKEDIFSFAKSLNWTK